MNWKFYKNLKDNILKENMLLKSIVLILALLVVFLVYIVVKRTDSQRTVFIPPQSTYQEFWVSGDTVSKSYLEMMGAFISYNLLNVTKDNSNKLISSILPLVDSSTYADVKIELQKMHNHISSNQLSRTFYIGYVEPIGDNQLVVHGSLSDSISMKIIKSRKVKLIVNYKIKFGLFKIIDLSLEDN